MCGKTLLVKVVFSATQWDLREVGREGYANVGAAFMQSMCRRCRLVTAKGSGKRDHAHVS